MVFLGQAEQAEHQFLVKLSGLAPLSLPRPTCELQNWFTSLRTTANGSRVVRVLWAQVARSCGVCAYAAQASVLRAGIPQKEVSLACEKTEGQTRPSRWPQ